MDKILFATSNHSKIKRFQDGLLKEGIELISLNDLDFSIDVEENGKTAIENALIKAKEISKMVDIPVIAMDDSLYLEGVDDIDQPGLFVRRVNGKRLTDDEMIKHYISLVKKYGHNGKLVAKWVYGMAFIDKDYTNTYTWNKSDFYLVDTPSSNRDLDYPLNSISIQPKLNKYFTDMTFEDKESIFEDESHVIDFIVKCYRRK